MNCRWLRSAPVADPLRLLQPLVLLLLVAARAQALKPRPCGVIRRSSIGEGMLEGGWA